MNFKKILALVLALVMSMSLIACGGTSDSEGTQATDSTGSGFSLNEDTETDEDIPEGRIGVTYWGTWGSDSKAYIQSVITSFNNSQSTYYVTMQYVGSKDDLYAKLQVTEKSKLPALINSTTEALGSYKYTDYTIPIAELAGTEDAEYISRIYANCLAAWSDEQGNLLGYPMGNSMTGIYCNMDILGSLGIDPLNDIKCVTDLYEVCKKVQASGKVGKYAIGFEHTIRFLNYSIAIEGEQAFDQDNGRSAVPSECYYNVSPIKELATTFFETYKKIQDEGMCFAMGSSWGNELLPAYATGEIAMLTGTIGGFGRLERAWNESGSGEINTVFIPWVAVTENGRSTGQPASGNGFYVVDNGKEDEAKGAWEFIKYFTSGENFAGWCTLTGYLPIAADILETDTYKAYMDSHQTLGLEYLMEVQANDDGNTFHPVSAVYTETSSIGLDKFNLYLQGNATVEEALDEMTSETNDALYMWKMANGK